MKQNTRLKHYRTCSLCEAMCGIVITHSDGKIISIKGDKNDPLSRGHICPKASALEDLHNDPDRLRVPMERTSDGWKEVSWKHAFDIAADGIRKVQNTYGRDAMATYLGNPNVHNIGAMLMGKHLRHAINSKSNYSATSVDQLPHQIVSYHLFGHQLKIPVPDIDHTDFFLILGSNPVASNGSIMTVPDVKKRLMTIISNGGDVVVIDPRKTETAEIASQHHFIKPGTDVLLLLAMINTLYETFLIKPGRLSRFTPNLSEIESYVAKYTPEIVEPLVGIKAETIRNLVQSFCKAKRPVCYGRLGVSVQSFGLLSQYLIMVFNILTGRLDSRGGLMFTRPAVDILKQTSRGHLARSYSRVRGLPEFAGEYPVATLAEEILNPGDGQIRALVTAAGNPVLSTPNGSQLESALKQLDFMVSIDFYLNETTRHANIILPPVSPLEREHYDIVFHNLGVRNTAKYAPALFKPEREGRHDWQIYFELENRLNPAKSLKEKLSREFQKRIGPSGLLSILLALGPYSALIPFRKQKISLKTLKENPSGIDLGPLEPCLPESLVHQNKKIDLNISFYMNDLKRVDSMFFSKKLSTENEFLLIGRRHLRSNNSWLHNSPRLVKGKLRCTAQLHPSDAEKVGLKEGQLLKVISRVGEIIIVPELTESIMPGVISVPHGWGHNREGIRLNTASSHAGVSVNDITDDQLVDELSGNAVLNGVPVRIEVVG